MNLASLDLNLLVALDALLGEASVSRAAQRVGLSQPAMSHALARLRDIVGDPLLVRVGARMELTSRAETLRAPLAEALAQVRSLFATDGFDPATSTRRFALAIPDLVVDLLVPPLVERVATSAPYVRLDVVPWQAPSTTMSHDFSRSVDLVLSCQADAYSGFHRQRLYTDKDALAVRRGHPQGQRLSRLAIFLEARHVAVVSHGQRLDMIDEWLMTAGVERRIALVVPSYFQAVRMAARTDLVAFVPSRLIAALARPFSLVAVQPPLDPGIDEQFMFHPVRAHNDPGSLWLRTIVRDIARRLDSERAAA